VKYFRTQEAIMEDVNNNNAISFVFALALTVVLAISAAKNYNNTASRTTVSSRKLFASCVVHIKDVDTWTKLQEAKKPLIGYFSANWYAQ
jgi:hypothetical protein